MPDDFNYINDYFNGALPPEEKSLFDKRVVEDPAFAESVSFYLTAGEAARKDLRDERIKRFRELSLPSEQKTPISIIRTLRPWLTAAAVFVISVMGWFTLRPVPINSLADRYIKDEFATLGPTMGTQNDSIQMGIAYFNKGKLDSASIVFQNILSRDSSLIEINTLEGKTLTRLGQYEKALVYFQKTASDKTAFDNPGVFYQAVVLLKRDGPYDREKAKILLEKVVSNNLTGAETATKWLKKW